MHFSRQGNLRIPLPLKEEMGCYFFMMVQSATSGMNHGTASNAVLRMETASMKNTPFLNLTGELVATVCPGQCFITGYHSQSPV